MSPFTSVRAFADLFMSDQVSFVKEPDLYTSLLQKRPMRNAYNTFALDMRFLIWGGYDE